MALVSIITPTKSRLALLCEALDSVAAQTFANWEHLIVDDGSDDGTAEEVERRAATDPRVRFIRREGDKGGANVCRNLGLRESRGDYVIFLDSDDLLEPTCLERRVSVLERNQDIDFATFNTSVFIKARGDVVGQGINHAMGGDDLLSFLYFDLPWIITGPIWRREALVRLGGFDESLPSWQDVDLHVRALIAGMRYLRFPETDHMVRWQFEPTKVSVEQRRSPQHLLAASGLVDKFEGAVRAGPGMTWSRQRALCSLHYFVAEHWVRAGRLSIGLDAWRAIRRRGIGPIPLHISGVIMLCACSLPGTLRTLAFRVSHKWKGWARLRIDPELVPQ